MDRFQKAGTRVGAWRVMSMIVGDPARNEWNGKLERAFLDAAAPDRLQALESLAKVRHPLSATAAKTAARLAAELADSDRVVLPLWAMAASGDLRALESLQACLQSADVAWRMSPRSFRNWKTRMATSAPVPPWLCLASWAAVDRKRDNETMPGGVNLS